MRKTNVAKLTLASPRASPGGEIYDLYERIKKIWLTINSIKKQPLIEDISKFVKSVSSTELKDDLSHIDFSHDPEVKIIILKKLLKYSPDIKFSSELVLHIEREINRIPSPIKRINLLLSLSCESDFLKTYCISQFKIEIFQLHKTINPSSIISFLEANIARYKLQEELLKCALDALERAINALETPRRIDRLKKLVNDTKNVTLREWFTCALNAEMKLLAEQLDSREKVLGFFELSGKIWLPKSFSTWLLETFIECDEKLNISKIASALLIEQINGLHPWHRFNTLKGYLKLTINKQFHEFVLVNLKLELDGITDPIKKIKSLLELPWWKEALEVEIENLNLDLGNILTLIWQLIINAYNYQDGAIDVLNDVFNRKMQSLLTSTPSEAIGAVFYIHSTHYRIELLATILQAKDINPIIDDTSMFFLKTAISELSAISRIDMLQQLLEYKKNIVLYNYVVSEFKREISCLTLIERIQVLDQFCEDHANPELRDYSRKELELCINEAELVEDKIKILRNIVDDEDVSDFQIYKLQAFKKEIDKLNCIDKIDALEPFIYEDEGKPLYLFAKSWIRNAIFLLPVSERVNVLIRYLDHPNAEFRKGMIKDLYDSAVNLPSNEKISFLSELCNDEISCLDETFILLLKDAIADMDLNTKMELLLTPIGDTKKPEFVKALERILHKELVKASKKIKNNSDMQTYCVKLDSRLRILFLQKIAVYQESNFADSPKDQAFRRIALDALSMEIDLVGNKFKSLKIHDISGLTDCTEEAMNLFYIDVCTDKDEQRRVTLLRDIAFAIDQYFIKNQCSSGDIANVLYVISDDNLELYYDYGRQCEDKNNFFKAIVSRLLEKLDGMLINDNYFSVHTIAVVLSVLKRAIWEQPLNTPEKFVENLVNKAESLFNHGEEFDQSDSFMIVDALQQLHYIPNKDTAMVLEQTSKAQISGAQFIAEISKIALPLILTIQDGPFKHFNYDHAIFIRCSMILRIIPQVNLGLKPQLFHEAISSLGNKYESFQITDVYELLPDEMVPNKDLIIALINFSSSSGAARISTMDSGLDAQDDEEDADLFINKVSFIRPDGKYVSDALKHFKEQLQSVSLSKNPRTLVWLLKRYSQAILSNLRSANMSYFSEDIMIYLQMVRDHILDVSDSTVSASICELCKELMLYFDEVTPDMAIRLLWLNMILSTTAYIKKLEFTAQQQAALFSKVQNITIDKQQARALFEIRTMCWHGGVNFPSQLSLQMDAHFKTFHEDSNASKEEDNAYNEIKQNIHKYNTRFLKTQGYICPITGHEIDIAYTENDKKIAINIDGPCHFDSITHQHNMKTIFRNICLRRAGWRVIDVDLLTEDYLKRSREIAAYLNTLSPKPNIASERRVQRASVQHARQLNPPKPSTTPLTVHDQSSKKVATKTQQKAMGKTSASTVTPDPKQEWGTRKPPQPFMVTAFNKTKSSTPLKPVKLAAPTLPPKQTQYADSKPSVLG